MHIGQTHTRLGIALSVVFMQGMMIRGGGMLLRGRANPAALRSFTAYYCFLRVTVMGPRPWSYESSTELPSPLILPV